jgi:hypothetical protein
MAIVRELGVRSPFITMKCNRNWPEITAALGLNDDVQNRPHLVSRVFNMKLEALLHYLHHRGIFAGFFGRVDTIEFHERGRDAQILITVASEYRSRTSARHLKSYGP